MLSPAPTPPGLLRPHPPSPSPRSWHAPCPMVALQEACVLGFSEPERGSQGGWGWGPRWGHWLPMQEPRGHLTWPGAADCRPREAASGLDLELERAGRVLDVGTDGNCAGVGRNGCLEAAWEAPRGDPVCTGVGPPLSLAQAAQGSSRNRALPVSRAAPQPPLTGTTGPSWG